MEGNPEFSGASYSAEVSLRAAQTQVFTHLDDPARLGRHMGRSSWMMAGGRMSYDLDEAQGQTVGSHIRIVGRAFGLSVSVDEVVVQRDPPSRKVWRTVGEPRLVIIGRYEMGFEISPAGESHSRLRVWIEYALPPKGLGRRLPGLAALYARWCVKRMVGDAADYFGVPLES
jgi:hypothetical protein